MFILNYRQRILIHDLIRRLQSLVRVVWSLYVVIQIKGRNPGNVPQCGTRFKTLWWAAVYCKDTLLFLALGYFGIFIYTDVDKQAVLVSSSCVYLKHQVGLPSWSDLEITFLSVVNYKNRPFCPCFRSCWMVVKLYSCANSVENFVLIKVMLGCASSGVLGGYQSIAMLWLWGYNTVHVTLNTTFVCLADKQVFVCLFN